ncbi:MAG: VWA domain-containing protein [Candidatus Omnitrophica bacterium]|nr:VWA domain-containing protein [Candidatus Omnitrophota bacterium]
MRFANPQIFHLLWLLPFLAALMLAFLSRRRTLMSRFVASNLFDEVVCSWSYKRDRNKMIVLMFVFLISIVALARPQWGYQWQEVKRQGLDILLVIDTSKSMLTEDVKPNRLERTKLAVKDLIKKLKGDRIGLVAFAGDAFMMCPLTSDYGGFLLSLNDLDTAIIPRGGTNVGGALEEALRGYDKAPAQYKAIILVTDGDNLEGDALSVAKKIKEKGIRIFCVGVGTQEGDMVRYRDDQGQMQLLKDEQGNFVKSRLNENLLQRIAYETGGAYVRSSGAEFGLDYIYEQHLALLEKREIEEKMQKKYFERFQLPLSLALALLLFETFLSRRRQERVAS